MKALLWCLFLVCMLHAAQTQETKEVEFNKDEHCKDDFEKIEQQFRCRCVQEDGESLLNYAKFHYCTMESHTGISLILLTVWLVFLFYINGLRDFHFYLFEGILEMIKILRLDD